VTAAAVYALNGDREADRMPFLQDSTAWIAVVSALGTAVAAVGLSGLVFFVVMRRGRRRERARPHEAPSSRSDALLDELARELERARDESRRTRRLSAIGSTIDLDGVLARVLEAAAAVPLVEAAMVVVPAEEDGAVIATLGMSDEEAARHRFSFPRAERETRARSTSSHQGAHRHDDDERKRGRLVLPVASEAGEASGTLAVFWHGAEREPTAEELARLEELAASAGPAIDNARRFREARKLADLDALTNLHNRRYFHDTLAREVARAHRYDRRLALVILDIDDFKAINERVGHLAGDAVLAELAERVRSVVREADVACRVGGDEFAIILPESTLPDAELLYRRLESAVSAQPMGPAGHLHLSAGIAELSPDDDAVSFFERADEAVFRAKETGKGHATAAADRPA
jgi:diguanylate cyclase (GGDEF)-like protein